MDKKFEETGTAPLIKDFVFDYCPECKQKYVRLYKEYENWEGKNVLSDKYIQVCLNPDCGLRTDYTKCGHWKKKPDGYFAPIYSKVAIRCRDLHGNGSHKDNGKLKSNQKW